MTFAVFHDYPGVEYGLPKFHDFPGPVVTLVKGQGVVLPQSMHWAFISVSLANGPAL